MSEGKNFAREFRDIRHGGDVQRGRSAMMMGHREIHDAEVRRIAGEYLKSAEKDTEWPREKMDVGTNRSVTAFIESSAAYRMIDENLAKKAITRLKREELTSLSPEVIRRAQREAYQKTIQQREKSPQDTEECLRWQNINDVLVGLCEKGSKEKFSQAIVDDPESTISQACRELLRKAQNEYLNSSNQNDEPLTQPPQWPRQEMTLSNPPEQAFLASLSNNPPSSDKGKAAEQVEVPSSNRMQDALPNYRQEQEHLQRNRAFLNNVEKDLMNTLRDKVSMNLASATSYKNLQKQYEDIVDSCDIIRVFRGFTGRQATTIYIRDHGPVTELQAITAVTKLMTTLDQLNIKETTRISKLRTKTKQLYQQVEL
jgi:hypothetical protein